MDSDYKYAIEMLAVELASEGTDEDFDYYDLPKGKRDEWYAKAEQEFWQRRC
jgi:hypothetical protein